MEIELLFREPFSLGKIDMKSVQSLNVFGSCRLRQCNVVNKANVLTKGQHLPVKMLYFHTRAEINEICLSIRREVAIRIIERLWIILGHIREDILT